MDDYACSCGCLRRLRVERSLSDSPRRTGRSAVDGMERQCDAARTRGHPESGAAGALELSRVRACAKAIPIPGNSILPEALLAAGSLSCAVVFALLVATLLGDVRISLLGS